MGVDLFVHPVVPANLLVNRCQWRVVATCLWSQISISSRALTYCQLVSLGVHHRLLSSPCPFHLSSSLFGHPFQADHPLFSHFQRISSAQSLHAQGRLRHCQCQLQLRTAFSPSPFRLPSPLS